MLSAGRPPSAAKLTRKFFSRLSSRKTRNGSVESTYRTNYSGQRASNRTERAAKHSPEGYSYDHSTCGETPQQRGIHKEMVRFGPLTSHLDASPLAPAQI